MHWYKISCILITDNQWIFTNYKWIFTDYYSYKQDYQMAIFYPFHSHARHILWEISETQSRHLATMHGDNCATD